MSDYPNKIWDERGRLFSKHPNGDETIVHLSRFHGVMVTASRQYLDKPERTEAHAYFGDPQALADWLASWG